MYSWGVRFSWHDCKRATERWSRMQMVAGSGKGIQATKRQIVERAGFDSFQREIAAKT